jgi:hypothetical protein
MLQVFVFNELAVVIRHWYEVAELDEEHGTRLELRERVRYPHRGSESASQLIGIDRLLWRVDLFDRIGDPPGSMRRAHHHVNLTSNEPIGRDYDEGLAADPFGWTERRLSDVSLLLDELGIELDNPAQELAEVRRALPSIMLVVRSFAPDSCDSPARCLEATQDTVDVVRMMTSQFRGSAQDPRSLAHSWPSA